MAEFATRRRAANSGAVCQSVLSGATRTARFVSTLTKPSAPPSARSLPISPRPARPGACGCGFAPRGSNSRCRCIKAATSDGSRRATPPSIKCSPTPSMPALTSMAGVARASCVGRRHRGRSPGGFTSQCLLLVLTQIIHVEVAMLLEPVLVGFDRECSHEPQAAVAIGKDAHDMGAAPDLLVQALQHVGR